jgi:type III secretion protein Q
MLETNIAPETTSAASGDDAETMPMSEDLGLPAIPRTFFQGLNAFFRRRSSFQLKLAGRGMRLAPTWLAQEPEIPAPWTVTLKVDTDQAELVISEGILTFVLRELDPAIALDTLNAEQAALIVEFALSESLAAFERAIGSEISVTAVSKGADRWTGPDRPALPIVLYVERLGVAWSTLRLSATDLVRLAYFLDKTAGPARPAIDVPLPFRVRVASATMSLAEIASIKPGDILLPDDIVRQPDGAVAVIGEHLVAPVEITPSGYRLGARIRRGRGSPWEWSLNAPASALSPAGDGGPDDVPVRVMFEAGALELDLATVQRLIAGSVIPLARPMGAGVDIVAGNRRIGRGSLARIGDGTGIRVTRLFGKTV